MSFLRKLFNLIILLLVVVSVISTGCRTNKVSKKKVQELETVDNQGQKAYQKEYKDAVKKHQKMQSANTREMTKQRKKQQKQYNNSQERSFWDRLFKKKCKTEFGNG